MVTDLGPKKPLQFHIEHNKIMLFVSSKYSDSHQLSFRINEGEGNQ